MVLFEDIVLNIVIIVISGFGGGLVAYHTFRVGIESRIRELEKEIELLEPIKTILLEKGKEHVISQFKGERS